MYRNSSVSSAFCRYHFTKISTRLAFNRTRVAGGNFGSPSARMAVPTRLYSLCVEGRSYLYTKWHLKTIQKRCLMGMIVADWLLYADYDGDACCGPTFSTFSTFIGVLKNADMSDATSVYNGYWEYGILYFRFPYGW